MSFPYKLILFTSESGNLAKHVGAHFSAQKPIYIHPNDDFETVFFNLRQFTERRRLIGMSVGFTKLIPKSIIDLFEGRLFNTHPGDLPLTAGLYGEKVVRRMIETYKLLGTITIHQVNEQFDTGSIVEVLTFPYMRDAVCMNLLHEYSYEESIVPKDYITEWINEYIQMLKLVEPTFVIKFIENQLSINPKKIRGPRKKS